MPQRRKPIEEKLLDGSYRPGRHGPLTPAVKAWRDGDAPRPELKKPVSLSVSASKMWDQVVASVPGEIWASDSAALVMYCEWWSLWEVCLEKAVESPTTQNLTPLGIVSDKIDKFGVQFGLSPKARATMPAVESTGPQKAKVATRPKTKLDKENESPKAKAKGKRVGK